ncbi:alpha/beta hydrolase family protein [Nocardioides sp. Soil805]|uniref:alpha/beta hydrolase family protein n=1 Tax=Nocardioides sp. Soil805 TaxID=1736416 RepID=UPI00070266BE|nr:alpha/beta hydrolase [Nocardioides sp. Soil805]KRF34980.1 esterase [Nocardioides sp. Soil805]
MPPRPSRRALLAGTALVPLAVACGRPDRPSPTDSQEQPMTERLTYGDDPSQWADLHRPGADSRGVVVIIHGGFWKAEYDASLGEPLAADLTRQGWTTLNVEYRRVGNGGGFPETFDDVHDAIESLAGTDVDTSILVTLGHSAGGHLATWAAARERFEPWPTRVPVTHVVSQAGVVDLSAAYDQQLGGGAVEALMGSAPDSPDYELADPMRHVPLDVPAWLVHAADDPVVPISQSEDYVAAALRAGAEAELVEVEGGHFGVIDVEAPAWADIVAVLDEIA